MRSASNGAPRLDHQRHSRANLRARQAAFHSCGKTCPELVEGRAARRFDRPFDKRQAALLCVALVLLAVSAGCGRSQPAVTAPQDGFSVTLAAQPSPPVVGEGKLMVSLRDPAGKPVSDARLQVEGNMSHAGMQPSFGKASGGEAGQYTVTIKWTMSGDWYVDLKATLADGRVISRRFPIAVHVR